MRSVSQIDNPRIGRHIHARAPDGTIVRGVVTERRLDRNGRPYFLLEDGNEFRPGRDVLTFYSSKQKAPRSTEGSDAVHRRDAAIVAANLRRQLRLAIVVATIVAITAGIAVTLLFVL